MFENLENQIGQLEEGQSFGEIALTQNKLCNSTVQCLLPSTFAVLHKSHFEELILKKEQKHQEDKINFF